MSSVIKDGTGAVDPILRRLNIIVAERPELSDAAHLYGALLPLTRDFELSAGPVGMTREQAVGKLQEEIPLLADMNIALDEQAVSSLVMQMAKVLEALPMSASPRFAEGTQPDKRLHSAKALVSDARALRMLLADDLLFMDDLLTNFLAGDHKKIDETAHMHGVNPELAVILLKHALSPALSAWARQLAPLAEGTIWNKDFCFICGTDAILGELRGNSQEKYLRCGQCGAEWRITRLHCPSCGTEDHRSLGMLYEEGIQEAARADVCEACRSYIKVIPTYDAIPRLMLPIEDLATVYLDYAAQERGYRRRNASALNSSS